MAASDPATDVPTPTGTLQGVAAFSWDGSAWQPSGRAGPSVATPMGVLRGVAAFNGGPAWQPAALAQPGVTTPTGTLDGVAVYTWSGSAWTPPGGTATPSTPHGALRGVAAFNWDGAAWQPAAQAGPSVATPYGVLDGVAMFGWSGSAWAAVGAPSLSLDFMQPGTLDPRVTFTRASTATYVGATGAVQTAAINAPRWDYSGGTLRGLLLEDARTNLMLWSQDVTQGTWVKVGGATVSGTVAAPDGTVTAQTVTVGVSSGPALYELVTLTTAARGEPSFWINPISTTGTLHVENPANNANGAWLVNMALLSPGWQRITRTHPAVTITVEFTGVGNQAGVFLYAASGTINASWWGFQLEAGTFPTSYIPTAAATVTRAQDVCSVPPASMSWFTSPGGSWQTEFIGTDASATNPRLIAQANTSGSIGPIFLGGNLGGTFDGVGILQTANATVPGTVSKVASTWAVGQAKVCANAGVVAQSATLTTGFGALVASGIQFMVPAGGAAAERMSGWLRRVSYWPRILSNAELQSVTQ